MQRPTIIRYAEAQSYEAFENSVRQRAQLALLHARFADYGLSLELEAFSVESKPSSEVREVPRQTSKLCGRVVRLFRQDGYGFIEAEDGRQFYFDAKSLTDASLRDLQVGATVSFMVADTPSYKGPLATNVLLANRATG